MVVRLLDHTSEGRIHPLLAVRRGPSGGDWRLLPNHLLLELWVANGFRQLWEEHGVQFPMGESDVGKSKSQVNVLIQLDQIADGQPQSVQGILDDVSTEASSGGDGHWIGINASVALLINGVLGDGGTNLLFGPVLVSNEVVFNGIVADEDWLQVVHVLSLQDVSLHVNRRAGVSRGNLGQLSLDVVREGTEFLNVDTSTSSNVLFQIAD